MDHIRYLLITVRSKSVFDTGIAFGSERDIRLTARTIDDDEKTKDNILDLYNHFEPDRVITNYWAIDTETREVYEWSLGEL